MTSELLTGRFKRRLNGVMEWIAALKEIRLSTFGVRFIIKHVVIK